jgi:xanthine dehydrogenase YagT iron-sulfur-binding subunit
MRDNPDIPDSQAGTDAHARRRNSGAKLELRSGAPCDWPVSRRDFVKGAGAVLGASTLAPSLLEAATAAPPAASRSSLNLTINGAQKQMAIDPRTSLLDLLREDLKLTGTKKGCDHGQCGACTVLVNGRRINSCLALAISHDGEEVTTVEGLAKGEVLDPVQQAFLDHDGYQCGYCTPGQVISAVGLIDEAKRGAPSFVTADLTKRGPVELTDEEIRERMSGNICRCGAYPGIVAAVRQAYSQKSGQAPSQTAEQSGASMNGGSSATV